eukprot:scaffold578_cov243-Pinguiococcus_pyrenoidosus.AAC.4
MTSRRRGGSEHDIDGQGCGVAGLPGACPKPAWRRTREAAQGRRANPGQRLEKEGSRLASVSTQMGRT